MYLSYYNLKIEPFSISADPKFLWLGEKHKEALAALKYGILANKGFLLLTGDVGTGKTTLIHALLNNLGNEIIAATVQDPDLEKIDFFNFIGNAFKLKKKVKSKGEFIDYFSLFLRLSHDKNKKVLLIIDEAQRLNNDLLEEIRLLSNIEKQQTKLINIFFVGQNEFNEILMKNENRALRQRITLIHTLETLNIKETHAYIQYRLQVAGSSQRIFDAAAAAEIYLFSGGYPRLINIICDHALLTGFVKERKTIDAQIIKECARELSIPIKSYEKENPGLPPPSAGRKPGETTRPRRPKITIRSLFLLALLILAAVLFYYENHPVLQSGSVKAYWHQLALALKIAKPETIGRTEPAPEPDRHAISAPITADIRSARQEPVIQQVPVEPVPEQAIAADPENRLLAENSAESAATGIRMEIRGKSAPEEERVAVAFKKISNIYFKYNSYELSSETVSELDGMAAVLSQNTDLHVLIKGYTDITGKFSYNLRLSELRAAMVKNYLVEKGLNPLRIDTLGMGPDLSHGGESSENANRLNRRVEIELK